MLNLRTSLILFLLSCITLNSQAQKPESVLWQISGNGLTKNSYLLGTIHIAPPDIIVNFKLDSLIKPLQYGLFEQVGEDINSSIQVENISKIEQPQPPLDSLFSPEEYALVDSFFSTTKLGSIKPHNNDADIAGMVTAVLMIKNGTDGTMSFDDYLYKLMSTEGKAIYKLDEDNDPEIRKFKSSFRQLAELLLWQIRDKEKEIYPNSEEEIQLYNNTLTADLHINEELEDGLLRQMTEGRNLTWLPKIIQKVKENPSFIAVGLFHLKYLTGIINLLRQEGFILSPIKLNNYAHHRLEK